VSTHILPLRIFCEYLERETKAKIALLLIQPKDADFGEGLTREVQNTADYMVKLLLQLLPV
jgi:Ni,Fe-hydrogenase maturation factor